MQTTKSKIGLVTIIMMVTLMMVMPAMAADIPAPDVGVTITEPTTIEPVVVEPTVEPIATELPVVYVQPVMGNITDMPANETQGNVTQGNVTVPEATPTPKPTLAPWITPPLKPGDEGWISPLGFLTMRVSCGHSIYSKEVKIQRISPNNTIFFVNGNLVDESTFNMIPKENASLSLKTSIGGEYWGTFMPGAYALTLLDGNGGHAEYALVNIYQGGFTHVTFIGHAVSFSYEPAECKESLKILSAEYGNYTCADRKSVV